MIIVVDLLKSIFIVTFIIFLFLEVIICLSLILFNNQTTTTNLPEVYNSVKTNTENIVKTLNFLVGRRINGIQLELFLLGKHMKPYIIGKARKEKKMTDNVFSELAYNMDTSFFQNFSNEKCVVYDDELETFLINLGFISSSTAYGNGDRIDILSKLSDIPYGDTNLEKLQFYFSLNNIFNKVAYLRGDTTNSKNIDIQDTCFWLIFIKTIYSTNLFNNDLTTGIERYMLFKDNGDLVVYPPDNLSQNSLNNLPYYISDSNCLKNNDYRDCFQTFSSIKLMDKIVLDQIYYDQPIIDKEKGFVSRACIPLDFNPSFGTVYINKETTTYKYNYFCIDFSFKILAENLHEGITSDNFIFFFSNIFNDPNNEVYNNYVDYSSTTNYRNSQNYKSSKISDIDIIYSSKISLNKINKNVFDSSILGSHQITSSSTINKLTLFHGLYYKVFGAFPKITDERGMIDDIFSEYDNIISKVNSAIKQINYTSCDTQVISLNETDVSITHLDSYISFGSWKRFPKMTQENFMISVTPIFISNTVFNQTTFTYNPNSSDGECNKESLFFIISFSLIGKDLLQSKIYFVLVLKLIRSYFLFSSSILFFIVLFFISMEIVTKYLIEPLKRVKKLMLKLIRDHGFSSEDLEDEVIDKVNPLGFITGVLGGNQDESTNTPNIKINNLNIRGQKKVEEDEEDKDFGLYCNIETFHLEELLNFLKKIIMMKTSGNVDYKERSKIYEKFLDFLDDLNEREYYRQCLTIIAYSKYQEELFEESLKHFKDLLTSTRHDEKEILNKNEQLEQKITNLPLLCKKSYINDFTENDFTNFPMLTQKFLQMRILKQKTLYFSGLMCYLEYMKQKIPSKKIYLSEGLKYLKESLNINQTLGINSIKMVLTLILMAKFNYRLEEYTQALVCLKDAIVRFSEVNQYFFEKKMEDILDSRVIFIIVNIIFEQIFSLNAIICNRIGKRQLSGLIYNTLLSKAFFISRDVQIEIFIKLNKFLFETTNKELGLSLAFETHGVLKETTMSNHHNRRESQFYNELKKSVFESETKFHEKKVIHQIENKIEDLYNQSKFEKARYMIMKNCNRKANLNKNIFLLTSEFLLGKLSSDFEMKEVMLKCIKKYLSSSDVIGYAAYTGLIVTNHIPSSAKDYNLKIFESNSYFFGSENYYSGKSDIFTPITYACEKMSQFNYDQYIFLFCFSDEFKFNSEEDARHIIKTCLNSKATLYVFVFDDEVKRKKLDKMVVYLANFIEAYLIIVKNFKVIEEAFQNISILGDSSNKRNILTYNYENHNYILGGLGKNYGNQYN